MFFPWSHYWDGNGEVRMRTFEEALLTLSSKNPNVNEEHDKFKSLFAEVYESYNFARLRFEAIALFMGCGPEILYSEGFIAGLKIGIEMEKQE